MAEDLGFIEVRIPESEQKAAIQKSAPVAAPVAEVIKSAGKGMQDSSSRLSVIAEKVGSLKDVITTITGGGGVRGTIAATGTAASALGGAAAAGPLIAAAVGIGVVAVATTAIVSFVRNINSRVTELARVSAMMARESAVNRLDEMKRDIKEARVMGPLYATISSLTRSFMNVLQPGVLLIKAIIINAIVPVMKAIILIIQGLNYLVSFVLDIVGDINIAVGQGLSVIASMMANLAAQIPSYLDVGGVFSGTLTTMADGLGHIGQHVETVGQTAKDIAELMRKGEDKKADANQWAKDTLSKLSSGLNAGSVVGKRTRLATS